MKWDGGQPGQPISPAISAPDGTMQHWVALGCTHFKTGADSVNFDIANIGIASGAHGPLGTCGALRAIEEPAKRDAEPQP